MEFNSARHGEGVGGWGALAGGWGVSSRTEGTGSADGRGAVSRGQAPTEGWAGSRSGGWREGEGEALSNAAPISQQSERGNRPQQEGWGGQGGWGVPVPRAHCVN